MIWSAAANLLQFSIGIILIVLNLRHGLSGLLFVPFLLSEMIQMLFLIPGTPWKAPLQAIHFQPADVVIALLSANFWLIWNVFKPAVILQIIPGWILILGSVSYIAGFALSLVSTLYLYPSFSVLPEKRKIIQNGPYRLFRHPIYTGYVLMSLGQCLTSNGYYIWLGFTLSVLLYILRAARENAVLGVAVNESISG